MRILFYEDPCKFGSHHEMQPQHQEQQSQQSHTNLHDDSSSGVDLVDLPQDYGDDPEEESFRRAMQKKKKRGRRM